MNFKEIRLPANIPIFMPLSEAEDIEIALDFIKKGYSVSLDPTGEHYPEFVRRAEELKLKSNKD
jgi:hypothetical protein